VTDYPQGDGHPECPACKGRGVVEYTPPRSVIPGVVVCKCVRTRDIYRNLERAWRGLSRPKYKWDGESPLVDYLDENLWIRAKEGVLRRHLRRLGFQQGPSWFLNVFSDADLMDAWLSRVEDEEVYDPDVQAIRRTAVSGRFRALVDLVEPPGLLVLRVGVKAARNSAMPEVFLEALLHRSMVDKPTWIVDTPGNPLEPGHLSFDSRVGTYLEEWPYLKLDLETEAFVEEDGADEIPSDQLPDGWEHMSANAKLRYRAQRTLK